MLCGAASAAPAAFRAAPEAFHSFSDLVRLASSIDGTGVVALDATPATIFDDMESASAGASRAPDDGPLHLAGRAGGKALHVGAPGARAPEAPAASDARYRFSVTALPQPQGWLLLLSGIAAAGWVARRRLRYPIHG